MKTNLLKYYRKLEKKGLDPERKQKILSELSGKTDHDPIPEYGNTGEGDNPNIFGPESIYHYDDFHFLQNATVSMGNYASQVRSLDELLERDKQREKDGFGRKIRVGRLVKPGKEGKGKIVVVPTTVEEKLVHDNSFDEEEEESSSGGSGEGEEGEVIGEQPVHDPDGSGSGPGQGEGGSHEVESNAYDLGKILTEKFELPNLKDKGKKRSLTRYTYEMTDRHAGFGQLLDKKATLKKILETNFNLGRIPDISDIDPTGFLISPSDKIYRILSREKDYESQAVVFFVRDYSGSMHGKATEIVVSQHVLIYSWLLYQYEKQVETRFVLHDTEATEVDDFYTYYNSRVAGGTRVSSAFRLVNEIVEKENLVQDYNIYVFHGTDGDDWDTDGTEAIPELKKMIRYANRVGISIAEHPGGRGMTEVERYLRKSRLLEENVNLIRLDVMKQNADESRLIEGIKKLISVKA
jgi:hypothetical protein